MPTKESVEADNPTVRSTTARFKHPRSAGTFTAGAVLCKGWSGLSTFEEVRDAAEILEEIAWLRAEKIPSGEKGGRPRFHYHINPRLQRKEAP